MIELDTEDVETVKDALSFYCDLSDDYDGVTRAIRLWERLK